LELNLVPEKGCDENSYKKRMRDKKAIGIAVDQENPQRMVFG